MKSLLSSVPSLAQPVMAADLIDSLVERYRDSSAQLNSSNPEDNEDLVLSGPHKEVIWQTDKTHDSWAKEHEKWNEKHKETGWRSELLSDTEAAKWVKHHFAGTDIEWAWNFMTRPILRADFLRYLLLLVHGGFYADADVGHVGLHRADCRRVPFIRCRSGARLNPSSLTSLGLMGRSGGQRWQPSRVLSSA